MQVLPLPPLQKMEHRSSVAHLLFVNYIVLLGRYVDAFEEIYF
jgi:hypothetical protein